MIKNRKQFFRKAVIIFVGLLGLFSLYLFCKAVFSENGVKDQKSYVLEMHIHISTD